MSPETALSTRLYDDIGWRIRELSELVRACNEAQGVRQDALLRAAVPVFYAHWEGYFVGAANSYLNFIVDQGLNTELLKDEFWVLAMRRRYKFQQVSGEINFSRFLREVRESGDRIFKKGNFERINGASNLKSDILKFCLECIGFSWTAYSDYFDFIDKDLLEKRNHIAHGVSLRFEREKISEYRDKIVDLMRITKMKLKIILHSKVI